MVDDLLVAIVSLLLVLLNGFFVASEFAIVKVRKTRINELVARGNWRARIALPILEHLDAYLAACQVGITIASIALGFVAENRLAVAIEPLLASFGWTSAAALHGIAGTISFGIVSFFHIVLGEQFPKAAAIQDADRMTLNIAIPLRLFYVVLYPGIVVTNGAARVLLKLFGIKQATEKDLAHSPEELGMMIETSAEAGLLNEQERALLESAIGLSERRVREIMVPRLDIVWLYAHQSLEKNVAIVREHQYTRYPLVTEDRERVLGMIHVKDLMEAMLKVDKDFAMQKIARPVIFVPEVASLDRALKTFQRSRTHLAVVVDEYGGVAGLITLKDVLAEIVGPLEDEFDEAAGGERAPSPDDQEALVDAGMLLEEVAGTFKFEAAAHANVDTIGGYVLQLLGRLPKVGDPVLIGRWRVEVAEMHGLRLMKLKFKRVEDGRGAVGARSGSMRVPGAAPATPSTPTVDS